MNRITLQIPLLAVTFLAASAVAEPPAPQGPAASPAAQIARGETIYAARCAACHGADLRGKTALDLAGSGVISRWPGWTAADLYAHVQTMPYGSPGSLTAQQYIDVTAFILDKNNVTLAGVLTADPATLTRTRAQPERGARHDETLTTKRDITALLGGGPTQAELTAAGGKTTDWLFSTHDYAGQRFVDLNQINPSNVKSLRPVCVYQVGDTNPFPANPIVYKGAMFITTRNSVISIDAATCGVNWRYDRSQRVSPGFVLNLNRGAAIKDGKLVFGTADGAVIALDAGTGKKLWQRQVTDPGNNEGGFQAAPLIYDDLVIIAPAAGELGVKGWVGAFRLSDGEPAWRFNTVPDDGEPGADTWPSADARKHGGGAAWGTTTLDAKTGLVYVPVGNPTPDFDGDKRPGNNLYTCAIVVLDVKTGKLVWYYQVTPHDVHDYDLTQASPQFSATVGGKLRNFVVAAGKEGTIHVLDRESHQTLYDVPITTRQNTDKVWVTYDTTADGSKVCPGLIGGIEWNGPAFNPVTRMLYVPSVDWCRISKEPVDTARGYLTAIDAATGKMAWRYTSGRPMVAAVTTTPSLAFTGELTGDMLAFDAKSGKELYRFALGAPISGGTVTYAVAGTQYVAVPSGAVNAQWQAAPGASTITVFALR
jgi:alcohol dehydrogenase (cytochrome c)